MNIYVFLKVLIPVYANKNEKDKIFRFL